MQALSLFLQFLTLAQIMHHCFCTDGFLSLSQFSCKKLRVGIKNRVIINYHWALLRETLPIQKRKREKKFANFNPA
jgi:hypothetical protein